MEKNVKCLTHEQKVNLASGFENSSKVMRTSKHVVLSAAFTQDEIKGILGDRIRRAGCVSNPNESVTNSVMKKILEPGSHMSCV